MHHQNLVLLALKLLLRDRKVKKILRTFVMCRRLSKVETDYANFQLLMSVNLVLSAELIT